MASSEEKWLATLKHRGLGGFSLEPGQMHRGTFAEGRPGAWFRLPGVIEHYLGTRKKVPYVIGIRRCVRKVLSWLCDFVLQPRYMNALSV